MWTTLQRQLEPSNMSSVLHGCASDFGDISLLGSERRRMKFAGKWRILDMELWDEDYLDMEVEAFFTVNKNGTGSFQFGLVSGVLIGRVVKHGRTERLEFTWDGNDECDHAFGAGWLKMRSGDHVTGSITFHGGDTSGFNAQRTEAAKTVKKR